MAKYAEGTTVDPSRSRAEIEKLLTSRKATEVVIGTRADAAMVEFCVQELRVRFLLKIPQQGDKRFMYATNGRHRRMRSSAEAVRAQEAEVRRLWRALLLTIKAKFEVIESDIETLEEAFLPHIVTQEGRTVGELLVPQLGLVIEGRAGLALPPKGGTSHAG